MVNRQTISGDEIQIFKRRNTEPSVAPRCLHVTTGCRDKTPGCPREKLCRSNTLADTGNDSCHTSVTSPSSERVVNEGGGEPSGEEARPGISSPARAGRSNGWPPNCVRGWTQPMSCQPKAGIGAAHDRQNGLLTADDSLPHFLTPYLCEAFNVPPSSLLRHLSVFWAHGSHVPDVACRPFTVSGRRWFTFFSASN